MIENLVLGAMLFGTVQDERGSVELLDRFVDSGGVWIDTADCYAFWESPGGSGGQSEELIGRWLARRPGARDRVKISTKVGCEPVVAGRFPETAGGLSATAIKRGIEGSLRRLGTDHVELYWAHMEDRATPLEETVAAFDEVVRAGTAGRIGCSNHAIWRVERARAIAGARCMTGFTALQLQHSYLRPRPGTRPSTTHRFGTVTDEVRDYAANHRDVAVWAYTPLLSGAYTRADKPMPAEYDHPGTASRLAVLDEVVAETGANRNQVVLAWLSGGDPPSIPIVGVSRREQLDEAFAGVSLTLTPDQRQRLDAAA